MYNTNKYFSENIIFSNTVGLDIPANWTLVLKLVPTKGSDVLEYFTAFY